MASLDRYQRIAGVLDNLAMTAGQLIEIPDVDIGAYEIECLTGLGELLDAVVAASEWHLETPPGEEETEELAKECRAKVERYQAKNRTTPTS